MIIHYSDFEAQVFNHFQTTLPIVLMEDVTLEVMSNDELKTILYYKSLYI